MDDRMIPFVFDFANRSFRDVADRDYIAARACHRLGLEQQFLWMALQATEKYIKGILLYNFHSTKKLSHNVKKAFDALVQIKDIPFKFPPEVASFLQYLESQGANRYFTQPFYTRGRELLTLDRVVWHLRLYCRPLRQGKFVHKGKTYDWFDINLDTISHQLSSKQPTKVRLSAGYLEKLVDGKDSLRRRELTWKNFYYGKRAKNVLKNVTFTSSSSSPTHTLHPAAFSELDRLVQFEQHIRDYFKKP